MQKMNGIELQYVAGSIVSTFSLLNSNKELQQFNIDDFQKVLTYTESKLKGYFDIATLANAYTEQKVAKLINENNNFGHDDMYSDSGGLQVISKGAMITDELRETIYNVQAKYSKYAMNFDEMPLKIVGDEVQGIGKNGGEIVYIDELISINGKLTAEHTQKQIDTFNELDVETKILPVLHGYDGDSFVKYANEVLKDLDDKNERIGGLSIASLRGHSDGKVGMMKIFDFIPKILNHEDLEKKYLKHIHFLGISKYQRIIPILMMIKKGIIPKETKKISFDSTGITKAYIFGKVFKNVEEYKNPRNFKSALTLNDYRDKTYPNIAQFYQNVHKHYKDFEDYIFESWEELAQHSPNNGSKLTPSKQAEKYGSLYQKKFLAQQRYCGLYHMHCYISVIEAYIDDELSLDDIFDYNSSIKFIFETFNQAKTIKDFADITDYFYTSAKVGRTDLRILHCKTLDEFKKKYEDAEVDSYAELGITKDVEIISEELKKPWIKTCMHRAKKDYDDSHKPSNFLF